MTKMIRKALIMFVYIGLSNFCVAQEQVKQVDKSYNNTFKQFIGNFYVHKSKGIELPLRQIGFYYERKIIGKFYGGTGYMQWDPMKLFTQYEVISIKETPHSPYKTPVAGELAYRTSYKMLDGYLFYKQKLSNKHSLDISVGGSYCWGENMYVLYYYQTTPTDGTGAYETRKASYWGLVPGVSYNYVLFKGWMNIGADIKTRCYSGRPKIQHDYGIHLGVNF